MVMITRSAYKKACENSSSSDVSRDNVYPPWCSLAKHEKRKPRKDPSWEIRSTYPLRRNIWEYLEQSDGGRRKRASCDCRQRKRGGARVSGAVLCALLVAIGVMTSIWFNDGPKISLLANIMKKEKLISLLTPTSISDECCHKLRYLVAELSRAEQALRQAERRRKTLAITAMAPKSDNSEIDKKYIKGVAVSKGSDTIEYGGRVALWGIVPVWRATRAPDTVLALRSPTPADCWPFAGSTGELSIELPSSVQVQAISIQHIRPDTTRSAPKNFVLFGILQNGTWVRAVEGEYKRRGSAKQYYRLRHTDTLRSLVLRVLANQGNPRYTCLYRVHVYEK